MSHIRNMDYWESRAHYAEQQRDELLAALAPIALKFLSGNSVAVDRATITEDEWCPVAEAIAKARGEHG